VEARKRYVVSQQAEKEGICMIVHTLSVARQRRPPLGRCPTIRANKCGRTSVGVPSCSHPEAVAPVMGMQVSRLIACLELVSIGQFCTGPHLGILVKTKTSLEGAGCPETKMFAQRQRLPRLMVVTSTQSHCVVKLCFDRVFERMHTQLRKLAPAASPFFQNHWRGAAASPAAHAANRTSRQRCSHLALRHCR